MPERAQREQFYLGLSIQNNPTQMALIQIIEAMFLWKINIEDDKWYYRLCYFDDEPGLTSLYAHHRYVAITKEGDKSLFLRNNKSPKEKNQRLNGQSQLQGGFCIGM